MTSQKKRPPVLTHVGGLGCFGTPEITLRVQCTESVPGDAVRGESAGENTLMKKQLCLVRNSFGLDRISVWRDG
jgi:hypothetical protein